MAEFVKKEMHNVQTGVNRNNKQRENGKTSGGQ